MDCNKPPEGSLQTKQLNDNVAFFFTAHMFFFYQVSGLNRQFLGVFRVCLLGYMSYTLVSVFFFWGGR